MTTFERIQELAKRRDKNLKEVSLELGYSKNYLYTLKTKEPAADKLRNIADYFDVSVDYLLGRTDNPSVIEVEEQPSMAKQIRMRMDTDGLSKEQLDEIESEMERFFAWRMEEIKREREQK